MLWALVPQVIDFLVGVKRYTLFMQFLSEFACGNSKAPETTLQQRIDPTDAYRRDRPEAATFGRRWNVHVCTLACSFTWARRTARAAWRTKFFGEGNFSRRMSVVRVTVLRLMS